MRRVHIEKHHSGIDRHTALKSVLLEKRTAFQDMGIYETEHMGRLMTLDGYVMLQEAHEWVYHEMIAHVPLLAHPRPEQVLVVGGGDGGTLREIFRHPEVRRAVLCEIDGEVIEASRQWLPFVACGLDDPRAEIVVGDGIRHVADHAAGYDVILTDSTDPIGPAKGLFNRAYYENCRRALRPGGIFVQQTESPFWDEPLVREIYAELARVFSCVAMYVAHVPDYPSGTWTFAFATESFGPLDHFDPARAARLGELRYYRPELQTAAFTLPAFMHRMVHEALAVGRGA